MSTKQDIFISFLPVHVLPLYYLTTVFENSHIYSIWINC